MRKESAFLKDVILSTLGPGPLDYVTADDSFSWPKTKYLEVLDKAYYEIDNVSITKLEDQARLPYVMTVAFSHFVSTHRKLHEKLDAVGVTVSEKVKVGHTISAMRDAPHMKEAARLFEMTFPNPDSQSYNGLIDALCVAANLYERDHPLPFEPPTSAATTTGALGYANAASTDKPLLRKSRQPSKEPRVPINLSPGKLYCWSCGTECRHSSDHCNRRQQGHRADADASNHYGGEERSQATCILAYYKKRGYPIA